jgi:hypothetical protein
VARKSTEQNGHARLDEAMALLSQNEAAFVSRLSETDRLHAKFERVTAERFARIEAQILPKTAGRLSISNSFDRRPYRSNNQPEAPAD